MKRNKPLIRKWIAALRGGKYHQVGGTLCNIKNGQTFHCCLGVACRVAMKNGLKIKVINDGNDLEFDGDKAELSLDIRRFIGITDYEMEDLVEMNDSAGKSFKEIADHIEDNILDT